MSRDFSNFEIGLAEKAQGLEDVPLLGNVFVAVREITNGCPDSDQFMHVRWKKTEVSDDRGFPNKHWILSAPDPEAKFLMSKRRHAIVLSAAGLAIEEVLDGGRSSATVVYNYRGKSHAAVLPGGFQPIGKERDDRYGAGCRMAPSPVGFMLATINHDSGIVSALPGVQRVEQFVPTSEFNISGRYPFVPLV